MSKFKISVNQLAEFSSASEAGKNRIISQQIKPDPLKVFWYQTPKAQFKKSILLKGDLEPIYEGIKSLMEKKTEGKHQVDDKQVSLEALERYVRIKLPSIFNEIDYSVLKPKVKSTIISEVEVIISPDLIIKGELNGRTVIGGVKFHICKSKPFDMHKSQIVSSLIYNYLESEIADPDTLVVPELCLCIDIFAERIVSALNINESVFNEIAKICTEVKRLWEAA